MNRSDLAVVTDHQDRHTVCGSDGEQEPTLAGEQGISLTKESRAIRGNDRRAVHLRDQRDPCVRRPELAGDRCPERRTGVTTEVKNTAA